MPNNIQFWFNPTAGTVVWFFFAALCLVVLAVSIRILFIRLQRQRRENEFQETLAKHKILGKPEEAVLRDVIARHKISPPASALANLTTFDQIASEEIQRTEREAIPLSDRVDRIEYLYSIRLCAFSHEISVGGIRNLLPEFKSIPHPTADFRSPEKPTPAPRTGPGESEKVSEPAPSGDTALSLEEGDDAMAKLLGS